MKTLTHKTFKVSLDVYFQTVCCKLCSGMDPGNCQEIHGTGNGVEEEENDDGSERGDIEGETTDEGEGRSSSEDTVDESKGKSGHQSKGHLENVGQANSELKICRQRSGGIRGQRCLL